MAQSSFDTVELEMTLLNRRFFRSKWLNGNYFSAQDTRRESRKLWLLLLTVSTYVPPYNKCQMLLSFVENLYSTHNA